VGSRAIDATEETMTAFPTGTVTFLFTDIEGSTARWERAPDLMRAALARHDALMRETVAEHDGLVFKMVGDSCCAAFAAAAGAVGAALAAQRALANEDWGPVGPLWVRMAIHTGQVEERDGDYFGPPLNRVARLLAAGHGGQTLLSHATHAVAGAELPAEATVVDHGRHRLKDLIEPEQIWELRRPDLSLDFPPLRTLDARQTNLPIQPNELIGRDAELGELRILLRRPGVRLLTLTGAGGTGKTRLALQLGAECLDEYSDGVFFVPLASVSDPELVPASVAQALALRESGGQSLQELLTEHLRERELLLVVDNLEQLLPASAFLSELLAAAPGLTLLATSRAPLHLSAEHEYAVPPLGLPPADVRDADRLREFESVTLFVTRARGVEANFELTEQNAAAVAEICLRLDGLPLALELAAARVKLLPPSALVARLGKRLTMLTGGRRDAPTRQQTLRKTIEWSHDLLDDPERIVFARLAVFVGGWTVEAAEGICGEDLESEVLDLLGSLLDKSLLRQGGRSSMLATIHEFALERLDELGERASLEREHAEYFLRLAEEAEPGLTGDDQGRWLEVLAADRGNLHAALTWSLANDADLAVSLAGTLWRFWYTRGEPTVGRAFLEGALANETSDPAARAKAFAGAAGLMMIQADLERAFELAGESVRLYEQVGDQAGMSTALNLMGSIAFHQGQYEDATALIERSLDAKRKLGDDWGVSVGLLNLGVLIMMHGDAERSRKNFEESLALKRKLGDSQGIAILLTNLGDLALHDGDYASARDYYGESLTMRRELGDRQGIGIVLASLSRAAQEDGQSEAAKAMAAESLEIFADLGDRESLTVVLESVADLALTDGSPARALRLRSAAEALREVIGAPLPPPSEGWRDRAYEEAAKALGQEATSAAVAAGRRLDAEAAVAEALDIVRSNPADRSAKDASGA